MKERTPPTEPASGPASNVQSSWLTSLQSANAYNRWILGSIEPHIRGRTLEIGCGAGTFTKHLAALADHVTAIDIDEAFIALAKDATTANANVTIEVADATAAGWFGQFETAVALEVIEHIEDDRAVLETIFRALVPGGRLVLKVPAGPAIFGKIDLAVGHHRRYARRGLTEILGQAGFTAVETWHFNAVGILGWWMNGKLLGRSMPPAGLSLFAVASKPGSD